MASRRVSSKTILKHNFQTRFPQPGLQWKHSLGSAEPCWTKEPQTDTIKRKASKILDEPYDCDVQFCFQGAFNKLYSIRSNKGQFLMRVSLPVDPKYKTLSEVATLDFVSHKTDLPVPKVIAFDACNDNELGFEWILMERIPGKPLSQHWRTMSLTTKNKLVKHLALVASQLFRNTFHHIGNLYHCEKHSTASDNEYETNFNIDRIVSMQFFWDDHINQNVPRGPFKSSQEWLSARLLLLQNDCEKTLKTSNDEDDLENATNISENIQKLSSVLPLALQSETEQVSETTALLHDDISKENVLVDDNGNLTGIVDWECVSLFPVWKVCQLPVLLEGKERTEMPKKDSYFTHENGEVDELFWEHFLEYEQTQLRVVFLDEMKRIEPVWIEIYMDQINQRKADVEMAVQYCDDEFCIRTISKWLDGLIAGGEVDRLKKKLMQ